MAVLLRFPLAAELLAVSVVRNRDFHSLHLDALLLELFLELDHLGFQNCLYRLVLCRKLRCDNTVLRRDLYMYRTQACGM